MSYHSGSIGPVLCPNEEKCTVDSPHWPTLEKAEEGYNKLVEEALSKQREEDSTQYVSTIKRIKEEAPRLDVVESKVREIRSFLKSDFTLEVEEEFQWHFDEMGSPVSYSKLQANEWELVSKEFLEIFQSYREDILDSFFWKDYKNGEDMWKETVLDLALLYSQYYRVALWCSAVREAVLNGAVHNPLVDLSTPSEEELLKLIELGELNLKDVTSTIEDSLEEDSSQE